MAVLEPTAPLALTTPRLPRAIAATRLPVETTLVLSRRAALQRRVRMRIVRARAVRTRTRRGTIYIHPLLRVRRLRVPRSPRAGRTIVRQARPLRGRIVRHNGRLRQRHGAKRAHHPRATKAHHPRATKARHPRATKARQPRATKARQLHGAKVHLHSARVPLRRTAKVHRPKGRKFLRNRARDGENQWIICRGRRLVLSCWPVS